MFLLSLGWGQREGRGGEADLSTLSPLVGAKQRKPDFSKCMNIPFPATTRQLQQHCQSLKASSRHWTPLVWARRRHRSPCALWCCFFPSWGTVQWLGQPRKLTHHRGALKTSLCFSSPLFAYQCFLGEREKWKNRWHLHLPSFRDNAALQQSSALQPRAGDTPLHEDRAGHTEKLGLLGVRRLQPEMHPATVYPLLMVP